MSLEKAANPPPLKAKTIRAHLLPLGALGIIFFLPQHLSKLQACRNGPHSTAFTAPWWTLCATADGFTSREKGPLREAEGWKGSPTHPVQKKANSFTSYILGFHEVTVLKILNPLSMPSSGTKVFPENPFSALLNPPFLS